MPTQQRYTGQYQDDDIPDLYFYNARWYDAQPGRFLQADTLVPGMDGLAWDRYAYSRNSPVVYSDPSGHKACELVCQSDYVDWNHAITGLDSDSWDHTLQKQRTEILDRFLTEIPEIIISTLWEPADWALTTKDCLTGNCTTASLLGLLPFVPGKTGKYVNTVVGLLEAPKRVNYPWHHLFPQQADLARLFANAGINIDEHLVSIPIELHKKIHRGAGGGLWNNAWEMFFEQNNSPTAEEIYKQLNKMISEFGLDGNISIIP